MTVALPGCANPAFIGVQDYGSIYGNAVSSSGSAIGNALVSATGTTSTVLTTPTGSFALPNVAVGEQTLSISAPGYRTASMTVIVVKGQSANAGNVSLTLETSTPVTR